jgi:hypothetical protein
VDLGLGLGVENQLCKSLSVTKVEKYQIAVVAVGLDPASQGYFFAGVIKPKLTAMMCSFEHSKNPFKNSVQRLADSVQGRKCANTRRLG